MKKKLAALVMAGTMAIGSMAGCGVMTALAEEEAPSFKFGFIHTSFSDQLGIMYQKYAQYAADELG